MFIWGDLYIFNFRRPSDTISCHQHSKYVEQILDFAVVHVQDVLGVLRPSQFPLPIGYPRFLFWQYLKQLIGNSPEVETVQFDYWAYANLGNEVYLSHPGSAFLTVQYERGQQVKARKWKCNNSFSLKRAAVSVTNLAFRPGRIHRPRLNRGLWNPKNRPIWSHCRA